MLCCVPRLGEWGAVELPRRVANDRRGSPQRISLPPVNFFVVGASGDQKGMLVRRLNWLTRAAN